MVVVVHLNSFGWFWHMFWKHAGLWGNNRKGAGGIRVCVRHQGCAGGARRPGVHQCVLPVWRIRAAGSVPDPHDKVCFLVAAGLRWRRRDILTIGTAGEAS